MRTESAILRAICDYLQAKNYYYWRNNNTGVYLHKAKCYAKTPKGFKKGIPDIFVLHWRQTIAIEVKSATGKQSVDQQIFQKEWEKSDFRCYYLVRSLDDVMALGLQPKEVENV